MLYQAVPLDVTSRPWTRASIKTAWETLRRLGLLGAPVTVILRGLSSSCTTCGAEPIVITGDVRVSWHTMGMPVPRGGSGEQHETMSITVGIDCRIMPVEKFLGIVTCLALQLPVFAAVVLFDILPSETRGILPAAVLLMPELVPDDGLIGGRDFHVASGRARNIVLDPWASVLDAVRHVNKSCSMAVNKRQFTMLSFLLADSNPLTHGTDIPEIAFDMCSVELFESLAEAGLIPPAAVESYICWFAWKFRRPARANPIALGDLEPAPGIYVQQALAAEPWHHPLIIDRVWEDAFRVGTAGDNEAVDVF